MRKNLKVVTIMEQKSNFLGKFFSVMTLLIMLEDALPYLPPNLKKVAAIYIKLTELSKISSEFDNEQTLSACGFDQDPASMELLLNALKTSRPEGNRYADRTNSSDDAKCLKSIKIISVLSIRLTIHLPHLLTAKTMIYFQN